MAIITNNNVPIPVLFVFSFLIMCFNSRFSSFENVLTGTALASELAAIDCETLATRLGFE